MNKNKMRTFLEIIYNCPLLLLVIITSFVYVFFFDETGILKIDKSIAVFQMDQTGVFAEKKSEGMEKDNINATKIERDSDDETEGELEKTEKMWMMGEKMQEYARQKETK